PLSKHRFSVSDVCRRAAEVREPAQIFAAPTQRTRTAPALGTPAPTVTSRDVSPWSRSSAAAGRAAPIGRVEYAQHPRVSLVLGLVVAGFWRNVKARNGGTWFQRMPSRVATGKLLRMLRTQAAQTAASPHRLRPACVSRIVRSNFGAGPFNRPRWRCSLWRRD